MITLVTPCYNEEENVRNFYNEVMRVFKENNLSWEVVFVNDGSSDKTLDNLRLLNKEHANVKVVSFSRNFGKDAAIYAGLIKAEGDLVCIIDADLQQRPEVVVEMHKKLISSDDVDCVVAYQKKRRERRLMSFLKSRFYKTINRISDTKFVNGASDFRLMKRTMVDAIINMPEYNRFSKGIFSYVGFNCVYMPYVAEERQFGKSKWNGFKLFRYAFDGIFSFSTRPLKFATHTGICASLGAIIYFFVVFIKKIFWGIELPGYATIVILILLLGGAQLFCLGILGEYIAKIFIETKKRPIYIIKEELKAQEKIEAKDEIQVA